MADLSKGLLAERPMGSISVWGIEELLALDNAVSCAEDMYEAMVRDSDTTTNAPRISIEAVTNDCFRVEISAQIKLTEKTKKEEYSEFLEQINTGNDNKREVIDDDEYVH